MPTLIHLFVRILGSLGAQESNGHEVVIPAEVPPSGTPLKGVWPPRAAFPGGRLLGIVIGNGVLTDRLIRPLPRAGDARQQEKAGGGTGGDRRPQCDQGHAGRAVQPHSRRCVPHVDGTALCRPYFAPGRESLLGGTRLWMAAPGPRHPAFQFRNLGQQISQSPRTRHCFDNFLTEVI